MKPNANNSIYFTFFGVFLLVVIVFRLTRKKVLLYDEISKQRKRFSSILSKEDDGILEKILEVYPEFIDYPELQNAFERDLSYESRIKKLRTTVTEIDQVIQRVLGLKQSVFEIEKGKIDKRVKVIRLKEQSIKITALRYLWPF
jgi:midasin (ATPase involved in ribosome maturation)